MRRMISTQADTLKCVDASMLSSFRLSAKEVHAVMYNSEGNLVLVGLNKTRSKNPITPKNP